MYGHYLFLGRGDWGSSRHGTLDPTFGGNVRTRLLGDWGPHRTGTPLAAAPEWSSAWDAAGWFRRIDFLAGELGADTLLVCLNGFELPYPSRRFPEAVERDHANVQREFFQTVLDYARSRGVTPLALLCTTGHAEGYARAHPEAATLDRTGGRSPYNLCHHHPLGREYARGVAAELLTRYRGFAGIAFHPPENAHPCWCEHCRAAFRRAGAGDYAAATDAQRDAFLWRSCLAFQREMEELATALVPGVRVFVVTIPGRFEAEFDVVAEQVPLSSTFIHWDYWSFGPRLPQLLDALRLYRSRGHRVVFMPSAGWSLDALGEGYGAAVREQVAAVRADGVRDVLHFVGAIWNEAALRATAAAGR